MPDDFGIKITGDASEVVQAANQASAALEKTASTATQSNQANTTTATQSAEATKAVADAHGKAGAAADKHKSNMEKLHKVFHAANEMLPGFGTLMSAVFNPVGAAIMMALMVLTRYKEKLKELNEEFKRMEEEAAKPLTRRLEAMREGTVAAASSMAELRDRLHETANRQQTMQEKTEAAVASMHQQFAQAQTLADAAMNNELSRLEFLHTSGVQGEEEYERNKLEIAQKYRQKKRALEEREEMTEILMRRRAIEDAEVNQEDLEKQAADAIQKKSEAQTHLNGVTPLAKLAELKEASEKALRDWTKEHPVAAEALNAAGKDASEKQQRDALWNTHKFSQATSEYSFEKWIREWNTLKINADQAKQAWDQGPANETAKRVAAETAARKADLASGRANENERFITEGKRDLALQEGRLQERHRANSEMTAIEQQTMNMQTGTGRMVVEGGKALNRLQGGGKFDFRNPEDVAQMQALRELLQTIGTLPGRGVNEKFERPSLAGQQISQEVGRTTQQMQLDAMSHGQTLSQAQMQFMQSISGFASQLHGNQGRLAETIMNAARVIGDQTRVNAAINELNEKLRHVQGQVRLLSVQPN